MLGGERPTTAPTAPVALPTLALRNISSAAGERRLRLSTPSGSGRPQLSVRRELELPRPRTAAQAMRRPPSASLISGFTDERNLYVSQCWELLHPKDQAGRSTTLTQYELEQQQKRRAAAINKAFSEISALVGSREGADKAQAAAAAEQEKEAEERARAQQEAAKGSLAGLLTPEERALRRNTTATGRVQAKIEAVRSDSLAKRDLETKVEQWRVQRSNGQAESRNYIRENRVLARSRTLEATLTQRAAVHELQRQKSAEALGRFHSAQAERQRFLEQRFHAYELRDEQAARRHEKSQGLSPLLAAKHLEAARHWATAACLASTAARLGAALEHSRQDATKDQRRATQVIHRAASRKVLRSRLRLMRVAMIVLRRNLAIFAKKNKLHRKVGAADRVRVFLEAQRRTLGVKKTVKNFVYNSIRVQRIWRAYSSILSAQLGVLVLQFDRLVRTKRSVDAFLSADEKRVWMAKVGQRLLELAGAQTNEGQREAKERKGKGKKAKGAADEGAAVGSNSLLQIDFDVKMRVLSRSLRERKLAFAAAMDEHREQLVASASRRAELEEMKKAREMFMQPMAGAPAAAAPEAAAEEEEEAPPKPPYFRLLLTHDELLPLINEGLLATADRIHAGLPIDASLSVSRALRRASLDKEAEAKVAGVK